MKLAISMIFPPRNIVKPLGLLGICTPSENDEFLKSFQFFYENIWKICFCENEKHKNYENHVFEKVLTHVGTGKSVFSYFYWQHWNFSKFHQKVKNRKNILKILFVCEIWKFIISVHFSKTKQKTQSVKTYWLLRLNYFL